ncbi:hypothetical protein NEF87_002053 [Candidatus Lokiarchaeum ossiferum]|uniref:Uncharacterized protein n=1 Tax=Candidatus Lokiarchaeum ossiferum TaxID=2951803 RepID=A0ABY6HR09_9ARCH|nr:hypothetical protein NEF87_002053 [Candidatus Lokiarchaeum sp. B-35]
MVKLGEVLVKIMKRIDALEEKIAKVEKNLTITGIEYGAFSTSSSARTSSIQSPSDGRGGAKKENDDNVNEIDKSNLIAEIQEAQRRKVEEDPVKRQKLQEQRKEKEDLLKASIMKAQSAVNTVNNETTNTTSDEVKDENEKSDEVKVEKEKSVEDRF